jgi:hypothetical protein
MTSKELKQAMKSLLETQASTSAKLALTIEAVNRLAETVERDRHENRVSWMHNENSWKSIDLRRAKRSTTSSSPMK